MFMVPFLIPSVYAELNESIKIGLAKIHDVFMYLFMMCMMYVCTITENDLKSL